MNSVTDAFKIDASRGSRDSTVSSQWFSRPDDQRFLSLTDMADYLSNRAANCQEGIGNTKHLLVQPTDKEDTLVLSHGSNSSFFLNNWSFGQLCNMIGAPASYLNKLPSHLAAENLNHGLKVREKEQIKLYVNHQNDELLAVTGPSYGRILDLSLVQSTMKIAGNGTGDARWKVPGAIDWRSGTYNPFVDVTKDTTTLYASDRDVFLFLVDDRNPIEIGKLRNGEPDLVFRGFYLWNSEVGSKTVGISTFFLRGVCQNRNLWGVEDKHTHTIRHTKTAADRMATQIEPALIEYANSSTNNFTSYISNAKNTVVAKSNDDALIWLGNQGFTKAAAQKVIDVHLKEEEVPPTSVWDFTQGITALARSIQHTDVRIDLEKRAARILSKV